MEQIPLTLRVVGIRPEKAPEGWAIHKAIRPLYGDITWEEEGYFYAAVAPHTPSSQLFNFENWQSKAITQEYVSLETALAEQVAWYKEHAPKIMAQINLNDKAICAQLLVAWRNRQRIEYERAIQEAA